MTSGPADLDPRRWAALGVCISALFITLLDVSIVNVALPSIQRGTGADPADLQWVVSGYALAFGMVPIIGGRLGDDRGRKKMLLVGIGSFVVFSAMVGLAPTPGVLIAGRVLQGLAGGLLNPQVSGLVQQLFPTYERGKAFGTLGAAVGIATAAGPVVGGADHRPGRRGVRLAAVLPGQRARGHHRLPALRPAAAHPAAAAGAAPGARPARRRPAHRRGVRPAVPGGPVRRRPRPPAGRSSWCPRSRCSPASSAGSAARRAGAGTPWSTSGCSASAPTPTASCSPLLFFCAYTGTPLVLALFLQEGSASPRCSPGSPPRPTRSAPPCPPPIGGRLLPRLGQRLLVGALLLFGVGVAIAALAVAWPPAGCPGAVALCMAPALCRRRARRRLGDHAQPGAVAGRGRRPRRLDRRRDAADLAAHRQRHRRRRHHRGLLRRGDRGLGDARLRPRGGLRPGLRDQPRGQRRLRRGRALLAIRDARRPAVPRAAT